MTLLLTGCGFVSPGRGPSGDPFSIFMYYEKRIEYPYGARWFKKGMTRESRLADWVACGGGVNLSNGFRTNIHGELMRQYLDEMEIHNKRLSICIQAKGYTFKYFSRPSLPDECTPQICLYP
ncbi:hypothetical protein [Limnohabitans sp.]|uniref:hypothetical protein n=1 Tax=Limnohabitans sp. TaxID=1907725 RepID=UPI0031FDC2B2